MKPLFKITVHYAGDGQMKVKASHKGKNIRRTIVDCAGCLELELVDLAGAIGGALSPTMDEWLSNLNGKCS
jgi:hypothetical protein